MADELTVYEREQKTLAEAALDAAKAMRIETAADAEATAGWLRGLAERRRAVEEYFEPLVRAAHEAHRLLTSRRAAAIAWAEQPDGIVRAKLAAWMREENERAAVAAAEASRSESVAVVVAPAKVAGVTSVEVARAEVMSVRELARAVADGVVPADLVTPNQRRLDELARALRESFEVPGCRVVVTSQVRVRR